MTYPISRVFPILALAVLVFAAPAAADYSDWEALADVEVIEVLTHDEDGDLRESKVWFVIVEGEARLATELRRLDAEVARVGATGRSRE